ncbi:MAG: hypothetical protein AABZ65_07775 [Candidatus Omnitrophota bacterium]
MATLKNYYKDLLVWEEIPHIELVNAWPPKLITKIKSDIRQAVNSGSIIGLRCSLRPHSSNQSIGNQVEDKTLPILSDKMLKFDLGKCSGAGYPDRVLTQKKTRLRIPLEVKATSDWNPNDSNRRVLTSSSEKIRKEFKSPIHHLLLTVLYHKKGDVVIVEHIRLDFLEPTTSVSVRLEASVNHKILSYGTHTSFTI